MFRASSAYLQEVNFILCNLYNKLCIKLVSIKEIYYDARPTKSQDLKNCMCFASSDVLRIVLRATLVPILS